MNIEKIVGYVAVAAVAIAVCAFTKDGLYALAITLFGFYFISEEREK